MFSNSAQQASPTPRVSVIVPAFNATVTLARTLTSVEQQTEQNFEVIIIDDGSTDGTRELAQSWAARDCRFSVRSQVNQGIAGARNTGIRCARAPLVAPLDADDLWHPTYLEKLCDALDRAGDHTLFAYANFRNIDTEDRVEGTAPVYAVSGNTRNQFLLCNFVGNGSGMVFRRDAALAVGGYEPRLQHQYNAQGCEDWLLQTQLSVAGSVVAVPEYLVGYRKGPHTMSNNVIKMRTSRYFAVQLLLENAGGYHPSTVRWARGTAAAHLFMAHWRARQWSQAWHWAKLATGDDARALGANIRDIMRGRIGKYRRKLLPPLKIEHSKLPPRRQFYDLAPTEGQKSPQRDRLFWRLVRAARWDAELGSAPADTASSTYVVAEEEQLRQSSG